MPKPRSWWTRDGRGGGSNPFGTLGSGDYDLTTWPRRGASIYGGFGDPQWDMGTFAHLLSDAGLGLTGVWGWGGWLNFEGRIPWLRTSLGGPFDLRTPNVAYYDDAEAFVEFCNSWGIVVLWTLTDLYPWSHRKAGLPGIPDAKAGPFYNNINNVRWGPRFPDEVYPIGDDDMLVSRWPDETLLQYIELLTTRLIRFGEGKEYIVGNEMPENSLHYRIRDAIRRADPDARVNVSRNVDAPSQYINMKIGHEFDRISFHGWKNPERMFEQWPNEPPGRPTSYAELLTDPNVNKARIIACSDGARNGNGDPYHAYDWEPLSQAFEFAAQAGCSIDHQSAVKMALYSYGSHDLKYVETDFLKRIALL